MPDAPTTSPRWTRLLTGELGLAICALVLFAVFVVGLLHWYFPEGTAIETTAGSGAASETAGQGAPTGSASAPAGNPLRVGTLEEFKNSVQSRSGQEVAWRNASRGAVFFERDALQTGPRSYALVNIEGGAAMKLAERSLVVFAGDMTRVAADFARPVAMVMRGELSGQVAAGSAPAMVRINGGALSVAPAAGAAAEYTVQINTNESATINILRGRAEFVGAGGTTTIAPRQSLTVDERGKRIALVDMPKAPALMAPATGARIDGRGGLSAVDFVWQPVPGVEGYRIVIARDRALNDRLADERVAEPRFHYGGLPVGVYYWSVQGRTGWTFGEASEARRIALVDDMTPPELVLDDMPRTVSDRSVTITGRTEPGARVFVAGQPAMNSGGKFEHVTQLAAGANVVVVESVDEVGNVAYASVMVVAK